MSWAIDMDAIGWYIATLHGLLGHDKAAAYLGQATYNVETCVLCLFERGKATREEVINRIGTKV